MAHNKLIKLALNLLANFIVKSSRYQSAKFVGNWQAGNLFQALF